MAHHSNLTSSATEVSSVQENSKDMQQFLSKSQYDYQNIYMYERCFGEGYMSAGGLETTIEFIDMLKLPKTTTGQKLKVLDVGCGIGGSAFYFAETYGAEVLGLDLSTTSLSLAQTRLKERAPTSPVALASLVTFELGDALEMDYADGEFDVIYSRDALLHVPYAKKLLLWKKFHQWLKPGGQLLISDYGCGEGTLSAEMKTYMEKRQYALLSPSAYGALTRSAGFDDVRCHDRSWQYCQIARQEIARVNSPEASAAFDAEFSTADRETLAKVFNDKVEMCLRSDRSFILCHAVKQPMHFEYRKQVLAVCKKIYAEHLVWGTDGNVSVRIPGTNLIAIKGSGIPYEDLTVSDIVICQLDGTRVPGEKKPSSEVGIHGGIYAARSDAKAVVHTHSMYASTIASCRKDVPCYHYSVGEVAAEDDIIKCADYHCYGTPELAKAVVAAIGPNTNGCLMANHGQVTLGEDLESAMYFALRMENICQMYMHTLSIPGGAVNLGTKEMDECRTRDKTYGQVEDGTGTGHGLGCYK